MIRLIILQFISHAANPYVPGYRPVPEIWLSWENFYLKVVVDIFDDQFESRNTD